MDTLWLDTRHALRSLRKNPGFTAVAVLTLALGIGSTTTVFTWIQAVIVHPIPGVEDGGRLAILLTVAPSGGYLDSSYPDFQDYRDQTSSLAGVIAHKDRPLTLGDDDNAERAWAELVSGDYFDVLGLHPAAGRFFLSEEQEEKPGAFPVAVISYGLWNRRFNADPGVVGNTIKLNRHPFTVIGVAPPDFQGTIVGLSFDVWLPLMMQGELTGAVNWLEYRDTRPLHLMTRLKPGVTLEQARAEVRTIAAQLSRAYPETNQGLSATIVPVWQGPHGAQRVLSAPLLILLAVGGLVLLIACANVANLLLARATTRQKEMGIRLALGASRPRVIRHLLTESLLLALLGGGVGVLLTFWLTDFLNVFIPVTHLPILLRSGVNPEVLGFVFLLSIATAVATGLAPAWQGSRADVYGTLKEGGRTSAGPGGHHLRRLLVISEVALAMVALLGAGLLAKSFQNARKINPGFDPSNILLVGIDLSTGGYDRAGGLDYFQRLRQRLEDLPGVAAVAVSENVPLGFAGGSWEDIEVEGYLPRPDENMKIYRNLVAPGYFDLMRIPLIAGRDFASSDDEEARPVVIVTQTFVRRFLNGESPLEKKVTAWGRPLTIVGVVGDIKHASLSEPPQPYMYVPLRQFYRADSGMMGVLVRTSGSPLALLPTVRQILRSQDPGVLNAGVITLADYIQASLFTQRVAATLLGFLGGLALLLASLGIYSVMAYVVAQRTHEIGIRMALGAQPADVFRFIARQGMTLILIGIFFGLAASFALARFLGSLLLDVSPADPTTYVTVPALLAAVAALACFLPARRATRVDPMVALRYE